ncbi:hypothetical protein [Spirosoma luteum]|uniref:hypothetical protein n=1 Tax=Spirosoma luteum TaxID=431553 RepID=UPI0012F8581B|nr:hypothetical protein [Spirosoma luteum]
MTSVQQKGSETTKLNDIQLSLLRLFDQKMDETLTLEVRQVLMNYFDQKLQVELDQVTHQKGYTEADYRKMLQGDTFATE